MNTIPGHVGSRQGTGGGLVPLWPLVMGRGWRVPLTHAVVVLLPITPIAAALLLSEPQLIGMEPATWDRIVLLTVVALAVTAFLDHQTGRWLSDSVTRALMRQQPGLVRAGWRVALLGHSGQLASWWHDQDTVQRVVCGRGFRALLDLMAVPVGLGLAWLLHPLMGAAAALMGLVQAWMIWTACTRVGPGARAARMTSFARAAVSGPLSGLPWHARLAPALRKGVATLGAWWPSIARVLILWLGGWLALSGQLTWPSALAAMLLCARALWPLGVVARQVPQLLAAWRAWQRLQLALQPGAHAHAEPIWHRAAAGEALVLDEVSAWVPDADRVILQSLSFSVPCGQILAVVGPAGAGKSTLARLLAGGWTCAFGGVWSSVDRSAAGYLPEDVVLLPGTIAENIARFAPAGTGSVVAAAERVGLHEQVLGLPQGYDTWVGAGGYPLAAGLRQRIGLARAIHGRPRLVLLDEPAKHLDEEGELWLETLLQGLRDDGCTVILFSTARTVLRVADRVLMLEEGRIVADELLIDEPVRR